MIRAGSTGGYVNPVPGGTVGRTDQGVDVSAPPGTPIRAITTETLVGIIQNWYKGQPFYWFKDKATGAYNYVAEQFQSSLKPGTTVQAGQEIGTVAPSGTGLELGWATASGSTKAAATTGYREGQATPAGLSYKQQIPLGGNATGGVPQVSLEQLWIENGGPPGVAQTMAAIAMAESSGRMDATNKNSNGTIDYGPWQVNSSHGFDPTRLTTDPNYSAKAAIAVYKQQGLSAWTTYQTGAFRSFMGSAASAMLNYGGPNGGIVRPGGDNSGDTGAQVNQELQNYIALRDTPRASPPSNKNPFQWFWASFSGNWDQI